MGNSLEDWGSQEIESKTEEDEDFKEEKISRFIHLKEKDEVRVNRILQDMENSYQRLERVLNIFNRM